MADETVTYTDECQECGAVVEWTTAAWEPREAEAPINANGRIACEQHADFQ